MINESERSAVGIKADHESGQNQSQAFLNPIRLLILLFDRHFGYPPKCLALVPTPLVRRFYFLFYSSV